MFGVAPQFKVASIFLILLFVICYGWFPTTHCSRPAIFLSSVVLEAGILRLAEITHYSRQALE